MFNAICRNAGAATASAFAFFPSNTGNFINGIWAEPVFWAELRLERCTDFCFVPSKAFLHESCRFLTLAVIGVTFHQVAFWHPVVRHDEEIGPGLGLLVGLLNRLGERININGFQSRRGQCERQAATFLPSRPENWSFAVAVVAPAYCG